ncbi:MAG: hypothetical protein ABSG46_18605 [Candidatus Binataceae bacterium]|jgi:hypothetical protein
MSENESKYAGLADLKEEGKAVVNEAVPYKVVYDSWDPESLHGKLWGQKCRADGYIHGDTIRLSTGTEIYANRGFVGISENMELSEGYDGCIDADHLTLEERHELADYMISLWQRWRAQQK